MNKKKIFNDPVYGFITVNSDLIFELIEHPYFQRLRRIKQLGMTDYIYPGALHTRFHHALGAMHLMSIALDNLRRKGHAISENEYEASQIAILLHDIGHGPFSHALEATIFEKVPHEELSRLLMQKLNKEFSGALDTAIRIFENSYPRKFFHELVSSQLDTDRLDYLQRDSFYTGVSEGKIGADRILQMLDIVNDQLVVEEKGIYSIENFLNARRLMYWQVYFHKTAISVEQMIIKLFRRARHLFSQGEEIFASPALKTFLNTPLSLEDFKKFPEYIDTFAELDDTDIWGAIKIWKDHPDKILSTLSNMLLNRDLFRTILSDKRFGKEFVRKRERAAIETYKLKQKEKSYMVVEGVASNAAYLPKSQNINILTKDGSITDVASASDLPNIKAMSKIVKKFYLSFPKNVYL